MNKFEFHKAPVPNDPKAMCAFLALHTGLSRQKIKSALQKGAVWLKPERGRPRRIRRATYALHSRDRVSLYYDPKVLAFIPPAARCLSDYAHFSLWLKPSGLLSQGSEWGDHGALLRQAEAFFTPPRQAFLVHRLDREASGVMMVAHSPDAAARISALFQKREVTKLYLVEVMGRPGEPEAKGTILHELDGRPAATSFVVRSFNPERETSLVVVRIDSGRKHQIRRHFELIGCPVMGDPRYGKGNKDAGGLKLSAYALSFTCPFTGRLISARLDVSDIHWAVSPSVLL